LKYTHIAQHGAELAAAGALRWSKRFRGCATHQGEARQPCQRRLAKCRYCLEIEIRAACITCVFHEWENAGS